MCSQASMIAVITPASSSGWAAVTANSMVRVPRSVMACALGGAHRRVSSQGVCGRGGHRGRVDRDGADVPGLVQPYRGGLAHRPVCHQPAQCQSDAQQADAGDGHRHHHMSIASTRPGTVTDRLREPGEQAGVSDQRPDTDHDDDEGHDAVQCRRCARHDCEAFSDVDGEFGWVGEELDRRAHGGVDLHKNLPTRLSSGIRWRRFRPLVPNRLGGRCRGGRYDPSRWCR